MPPFLPVRLLSTSTLVLIAVVAVVACNTTPEPRASSPASPGSSNVQGIVLPPGWPAQTDEHGNHRGWAASGMKLHVLGVAQDGGVPHLGCQKPCCTEARERGIRIGPASLAVHDHLRGKTLLVEATPNIEEQIAPFVASPRRPVEGILLTHAHIGHYTGLIHLGREVASTESIPVHCTPAMAEFLSSNGPWDQLVRLEQIKLQALEAGKSRTLDGFRQLRITPIEVNHRDEYADTVAWRIEGPRRTVVFCPDIDSWEGDTLEQLIEGADVCYLDATFYDGRELPGRDLSEIPHPPMVETMDRLQNLALDHPGRFRFIHLNHTNPALHDPEIRAEVRARGFGIAEVGESLYLD